MLLTCAHSPFCSLAAPVGVSAAAAAHGITKTRDSLRLPALAPITRAASEDGTPASNAVNEPVFRRTQSSAAEIERLPLTARASEQSSALAGTQVLGGALTARDGAGKPRLQMKVQRARVLLSEFSGLHAHRLG